MQKFSSTLEVFDSKNIALKIRENQISVISGIGPPDMCIVTREYNPKGLKRLVSKTKLKTYYHYVYGVDTSSISSIAAYFKHFLDSYNSNFTDMNLKNACFCVFDLFSKLDLRVEINFPGNITAYLTNNKGQKFDPSEVNWKGSYLSSALRYCYPVNFPAVVYIDQFKKIQDFDGLFEVSLEFIGQLGFVIGDLHDTKRYGKNLLIPAISKYLLKRRRYSLHQALIKRFISKDPLILTFLVKSSVETGKFDEILQLLTSQIKTTPHAFPLYYSLAWAYYKKGEISQAQQICQYLLELNLEVYEYWELLVLCYVKNQDFHSAVLAFNFLPHYSIEKDEPIEKISDPSIVKHEVISFSASSKYWNTPVELDFKAFEEFDLLKSKKEKNIIKKLDSLLGNSLSGSKKRAFKLLAKIEKQIEWNTLIKITSEVFLPDPQKSEILVENIEPVRSGFTRSYFPTIEHELVQSPVIASYVQPISMLTRRDYFFQDSKKNRLSSMMSPPKRVQNENTVEIFNTMNEDLKVYYEWQKQSSDIKAVHAMKNNKVDIHDIPYSGELWIRRGQLSERLLRYRQAERAYRYVVDKGFSLFAWSRLMRIYVKAGNPKAVLVCIIELTKQLKREKVELDAMPPWIEEIMTSLCKGCGFRQIASLAEELSITKGALFSCIERLKYWKCDGVRDN